MWLGVEVTRSKFSLDTTGSSPGYHQVERNCQYPQETYTLTSLEAVEQFWHRLWEVCIFTPLGGSLALTGQEITLEVMERKPAMVASLAPRTAENAPSHDDGSIPGDGLGAETQSSGRDAQDVVRQGQAYRAGLLP